MTRVFSKVFRGFHPIETSPSMLAGNTAERQVFAIPVPQLGGSKQMNIFTFKAQKDSSFPMAIAQPLIPSIYPLRNM
jgi:hypothetical protein